METTDGKRGERHGHVSVSAERYIRMVPFLLCKNCELVQEFHPSLHRSYQRESRQRKDYFKFVPDHEIFGGECTGY